MGHTQDGSVEMNVTRYLNRLSDYFFMAARYAIAPNARTHRRTHRHAAQKYPFARHRRHDALLLKVFVGLRWTLCTRLNDRCDCISMNRIAALEQGKEEVVYQKKRL